MAPPYRHELKIPKDRIAVLIGKNGETKKEIEELTSSKVEIDSGEGDVTFESEDPLKIFTCKEMILAIGRGFNPEVARDLIKQDYILEIVAISDAAKEKNHLKRIKGRVIGSEGKARKVIEELTETDICVYGKTIGIIGRADQVGVAKRAVEMLVRGSPHASIFRWLEKQRRIMKMGEQIPEEEIKKDG